MDLLSTSRRAFRRAAQKLECMMPQEFHENIFGGGDSNRVRNRGGSSWLSDRSFHTSDSIYGSSTWRSAAGSLLSMLPLTSQLRKRRHSLAKPGTVNVPPINRLPTEVLCFIFIICADNDQLLALDSTFVPFRLTHVCALWRQIALDLPVLWHRIDLNLNSCLGTGRHSKLASICVERARGLGLDISYHEFTRDNLLDGTLPDDLELHEETKLCHCLLNFIVKHLAQIKRLDITVGEESARRLASHLGDPLFALEKLNIQFHCSVPDPQIFERLYSGPSLADLTWHAYDCTSYVVECPVNVPWQQLVELDLHACPITQNMLMYILDKAVLLQSATTRLYCTDVAMPRARRPIRHTSLQYISLEGDGPLDTVFTICSFPALRSLDLVSDTGRDADPNGWPFLQPDLLTRIVKQAKAGLESLCLDSCGTIDESTLVSVFGLP
ncbi:uncharacterized protein SCHCODRAFT_02031035 [Schizophyllum commune H4-8]|uniref:uncharacterized protein n=1 Tax=Schizophyllum commune (strain H4-8 / FGSC 9210) TaxID=578458 RepID=UPI00215F73FA|nr:uncharacterized protein SCHCODRAFT_02031035 [Schizophyllum commune H4-8]KAI5900195.1 hypothetical protein SCHCODRAFT_02031035 [Schizophyllum commune H4-8]